jgi:hypothetical protein
MEPPVTRAPLNAVTLWGVAGFCMLLLQAVYRLAIRAYEPIAHHQLTRPWHWVLLAASILVLGYSEGYRAFQRRAAPRIVARAIHLAGHPRPLHVVLAPFYCTGLFHATRRRLIASWVLYGMLVVLIVSVRQLAQPWRGIVDAGVVVGLGWGTLAIIIVYVRAVAGRPPLVSPELPGEDSAAGAAR